MKRSTTNLILALVLLGLGVAVWFSREQPEPAQPLTALRADALERIEIAHPGKPAIVLEKSGEAWRLTAPVNAPTDAFEIKALLDLAGRDTAKAIPLAEVEPTKLGLDPPQYTIRLNDSTLEFGAIETLEYRRYVRVGDTVFLTADPPSAALDADYSDLVAKDLLPADLTLQQIAVPGLTLTRSDSGWALDPADPSAGSDRIQRFVDGWQHARALWNAAGEPGDSSAGEPIRLTTADGKRIELRLLGREPQLVLARPDYGIRYQLSKALAGTLLQLPPAETADDSAPAADAADGG